MRKFDLMSSVCLAPAGKATNGKPVKDTFYAVNGKAVTSDDDIATAHVEMSDADLSDLSPKQIAAIVRSIPGDGKDSSVVEARLEALANAEPETLQDLTEDDDAAVVTVLPLSSIAPMRQEAVKFGSMFDDRTDAHVDVAANTKEDYDGSPIITEADLQRQFGEQRDNKGKIVRKNLMAAWPIPGSGTKKWNEAHPGYNGRTDAYSFVNAAGETERGTFFGDMLNATPKGKLNLLRLEQIAAVGKNQEVPPGTPEHILKLASDERGLEAEARRWRGRQTNRLRKFRIAIAFMQQKELIKELLPNVGWRWSNQEVGKPYTAEQLAQVAKLGSPIILYVNAPGGAHTKPQSLTAFTRFNVQTAANGDGTVAALMATAKRKPKVAAAASKEGAIPQIPNFNEAHAMMTALENFFEDTAKNMEVYKWINGDDKVAAQDLVHSLRQHFDAFYQKFAKQLRARNEAEISAREEQAGAKVA